MHDKIPIIDPPAITNLGKCFHIWRFLTTSQFFGHTCSVWLAVFDAMACF